MVYLENGLQHGIRILENGKILALAYTKGSILARLHVQGPLLDDLDPLPYVTRRVKMDMLVV